MANKDIQQPAAQQVPQKAIAESYEAFLKAAESTYMALSAMLTGQPIAVQPSHAAPTRIQMPDYLSRPAQIQQPVMQPVYPAIPVTPAVTNQQAPEAYIPQEAAQPVLPVKTEHAHAPSQQAIPDNVDFKEMLLNVVSEKTGYPKEILTVEMGLEADLGIDSTKRVEILSAIKDQHPWLPEVDPTEMGNIVTLGDVLSFIEKFTGVVKKTAWQLSHQPLSPDIQKTLFPQKNRSMLPVPPAWECIF